MRRSRGGKRKKQQSCREATSVKGNVGELHQASLSSSPETQAETEPVRARGGSRRFKVDRFRCYMFFSLN